MHGKNKVRQILAILVCLTLVSLLLCSCGDIYGDAELNRNRQINAVNHRGYGDAPENTLAAFRLSKEMGFDMVECDVRFTKDNVPVLLHDLTVNDTSNGSGRICRMTLEQARTLDFGSWKGPEYEGEQIPTFTEFIDLCVELQLHPYIEVKFPVTSGQIATLTQIVDSAGISVTWIARNASYLSKLHKLRPNDRLGLVVDVVTTVSVKSMLSIDKNLTFIDAKYSSLSNSGIRISKKKGIPLEVWTVDDIDTITHIDAYISGITSNRINAQTLFDQI